MASARIGAASAKSDLAAGMRYSEIALRRDSGRRVQGDWLSGRAPRSHRGGHWFDPSIAHPVSPATVPPAAVSPATVSPTTVSSEAVRSHRRRPVECTPATLVVAQAGAAERAMSVKPARSVMAASVAADPAVVPAATVRTEYAVPPGTDCWNDEVAFVSVCGAGQRRLPAITPDLPDDTDDPASDEHPEEDHEFCAAGHRPPPFASRQTQRRRVSPRVYRSARPSPT